MTERMFKTGDEAASEVLRKGFKREGSRKYGYARASSTTQDYAVQVGPLKAAGCDLIRRCYVLRMACALSNFA